MPATVMSSPSEPVPPAPPPLGGVLVPTVPLAHARLVVHVVSQRGVDKAELLKEAGVEPHLLDREEGEVYATEYAALLSAAMKLTRDPCLGFEIGTSMPPTMYGTLGHALLAAGNVADAVDIAVTYWRLMGRFMDVAMSRSETEVRLIITERIPLGPLQRVAYESVMGGWVYTARHLLGRFTGPLGSKLRFTFPYDAAYERYAERLPDVEFGCPINEIIIPIQHLDTSLPMGHPEAARQARAACDAALARMSEQSSLLHQVANSLALTAEGYPTMAQVARRLGITPRTLARHLDRHGVTFRQVLDERRHQEACTMLVSSPQPVEDIASRLGYNDPANFTRAFRRWAGCTPTQYRQRHAQSAR